MFGKNKDKKQATPQNKDEKSDKKNQLPKVPIEEIDVHAMPQKFLSGQTSKPKKKKPKLLIILVVVILILLLSVGAALLFRRIIGTQPPNQPTNLAENNNVNQEENANIVINLNRGNENENKNANENENASQPENQNQNTNLNTNQPANTNQNQNTNTNRNYNTNTNSKIPATKDSDGDELTDTEESLYATEIDMPDTDSDGYIDGAELKQGYSPIGPGMLNKTDIVKTYANNSYSYSINYPARWLARAVASDNSEVLFTSDTVEFVQITAVENIALLTIKEWYLTQFPEVTEEEIIYVPLGDLLGIINPNGQTIYIAEARYVYSINYNTGLEKEANFFATFEMMYRSFTTDGDTLANTNSNSNSNVNTNTNQNQNSNSNQNSNQNVNANQNSNSNTNSNQNSNDNSNSNSNANQNSNSNSNQNNNSNTNTNQNSNSNTNDQ